MAYGTIKCDNITFDNGGVDKLITVSGLFYSTSGALTVTGAISGGSVTAPTATFTTLTGTTTAGTTATFTSGSFTSLTGVTTTVTSGIFALGSATAPSITISGYLNTGIYSPGAHQLAITTSGTGRLFVDGSGRVGIGVTPVELLDVAGNIRQTGNTAGTANTVGLIDFYNTNSTTTIARINVRTDGATNSGSYRISTANAGTLNEVVRIDSSGRVGINTLSPGALLSVNGNAIIGPESGTRLAVNLTENDKVELQVIDSTSTARALALTVGTTEAARIDNSGRLLVGTSSTFTNVYHASTVGIQAPLQVRTATNDYKTGTTYLNYSASGFSPVVTLGLSKNNTAGSNTVVAANDELGYLQFVGNDGTNFRTAAWIASFVDGTPGANDMPGRLVFSTTADGAASPTEHMRISSNGKLDYTWSSVARNTFAHTSATAADAFGLAVIYTSSPNTTTNDFLYCAVANGATLRATIYSNGGLGNIQSNNVNLSDRNAKKDISLADDTWNCVKEWEIVNYRYVEQPDDADLSLGVIAQQVAESCPELITVFQEAKEATEDTPAIEERLGVKEQQMYWMAIKALQEAIARIETLETRLSTLESA